MRFNPEGFNFEKEPEAPKVFEIEMLKSKERQIEILEQKEKCREIRSLKITTPEGKEVDFVTFLPPGWKIFEIERTSPEPPEYFTLGEVKSIFFYSKVPSLTKHYFIEEGEKLPLAYQDEKGGREVFPWGEVFEYEIVETQKDPYFLLSILHEIGHARKHGRWFDRALYSVMFEKRKKVEKLTTLEEKKKFWEYVIRTEREAWAFALKKYRELKEMGIDILSGKSADEIIDEVNFSFSRLLFVPLKSFLPKEVLREVKKRRPSFVEKLIDFLKEWFAKEKA
jgi:hypothetical protein